MAGDCLGGLTRTTDHARSPWLGSREAASRAMAAMLSRRPGHRGKVIEGPYHPGRWRAATWRVVPCPSPVE